MSEKHKIQALSKTTLQKLPPTRVTAHQGVRFLRRFTWTANRQRSGVTGCCAEIRLDSHARIRWQQPANCLEARPTFVSSFAVARVGRARCRCIGQHLCKGCRHLGSSMFDSHDVHARERVRMLVWIHDITITTALDCERRLPDLNVLCSNLFRQGLSLNFEAYIRDDIS